MSKFFDRAFFVDLATGKKPALDKPTTLAAIGVRPTVQVNVLPNVAVAATRLRVLDASGHLVAPEKMDKFSPYRVLEDSQAIAFGPGKYTLEATPLDPTGKQLEGASTWAFEILPAVTSDGEPSSAQPDKSAWSSPVHACISLDEVDSEADAIKLAAMARACGVVGFRTFGPSLSRLERPGRGWVKPVNWLTSAGMQMTIMWGPNATGDRSADPRTADEWATVFRYIAEDRRGLINLGMITDEGPNEIDLKKYFNRWCGKASYSFDLNVVLDVMYMLRAMRAAFGPAARLIGPSVGMPIASLHKQYATALANAGMMQVVNEFNAHGYFDTAAEFEEVYAHYTSLGFKTVNWSEIEPRGSAGEQAKSIAVVRRYLGKPRIYRFTTRPKDVGQEWASKNLHNLDWGRNEAAIKLWGLV